MISKKTTFILGAGASHPFGLPTGIQLRNSILDLIGPANNHEIPQYLRIFEQCGHSYPELILFRDTFLKSQKKSIDAFLEHRTEYIKLGKLLIAHKLLACENLDTIYKNSDWYGYFWDKLNSSFDKFDKNKVSFITFNYDRTLENYLLSSMVALYNKSEKDCYDKLSNIPIVHVHSTIGKSKFEDPMQCTPFGKNIRDYNELILAAKTIKIIHEDIAYDIEFDLAHKLIREADQIIILGLSYDETNLMRLKLNDAYCHIVGSSFGLTAMECDTIKLKFPKINFSNNYHHQALDFLRHSVMLQ